MTELSGERALRLMPDHNSVEMYQKGAYDSKGQYWRIESNGCLRNREIEGKCLAVEGFMVGAFVSMQDESRANEQTWEYTNDKYLQSKVFNDVIIQKGYLVLNVMWADIPLITDGVSLHMWHKDNTLSEKWNVVPVDQR